MRNEVQPDSQVHALLQPIDAKATEAQLHLGQLADALLLRIRYAVLCGVVPVDTEQREAQACSAWSTSACISARYSTWMPLRSEVPVIRVAAEASRSPASTYKAQLDLMLLSSPRTP